MKKHILCLVAVALLAIPASAYAIFPHTHYVVPIQVTTVPAQIVVPVVPVVPVAPVEPVPVEVKPQPVALMPGIYRATWGTRIRAAIADRQERLSKMNLYIGGYGSAGN